MANQQFTPNELKVIKAFTQSDFFDGFESIIWDFSLLDVLDMAPRTRSGVFSSLQQKEFFTITEKTKKYYIDSNGVKQRTQHYYAGEPETKYGTYALTEKCVEALKNANLIHTNGYTINY